MPIDLCMEAIASNATFVARSFAGDAKQVKELVKAAITHKGLALLDIISPCVTFNNNENAHHSYTWGKDHESPLHEFSFVPAREEITVVDYEPGTVQEVELHDGSMIRLKKLQRDYNPTSRWEALKLLEDAQRESLLMTGLVYLETGKPDLLGVYNLVDTPLNRLTQADLRPGPETMSKVNALMF